MYLKKIELFGFKSFAERTTISFEQGVSAIVGPNGCGKSNISDAIRWVLGEKRPKLLRGSKMEDLIFAGTEFRKPLGFAEVSLTISNEDRLFPLEYENILLSRRLYRNGESEYRLNKTPCRLKDIQDLIANTGIGSNEYSMVEQGEIDYIVQAKADERRFLIEEAAGISKYKNKKEEALRKLERTENNLQRVNDIIAEIEKNIKYAERQARRAENFRQKFDLLKTLELAKAHRDLQAIHEKLKTLTDEKSSATASEGELGEKLSAYHARLQEIETSLRHYENDQQTYEEKRYLIKTEISTLQDKCTFNSQKRIELEERNGTLENEITLSQGKISAFKDDLQTRQSELEQFYQSAHVEREKLEAVKGERDALVGEIENKKHYIHNCQSDVMDIASELTKMRNEYNKIKNEYTGVVNKKARMDHTLVQLQAEEEEIQKKMAGNREEVSRVSVDYTTKKAELDTIRQEKSVAEENLEQIREALLFKRGSVQGVDSKIKALEELTQSLSLFKEGTKALIAESKQADSPYNSIGKTVLDVIEVAPGYERAIQGALAECLYSIVVESYNDALNVIRYVEEGNKGAIDIFIDKVDEQADEDFMLYQDHILGRAADFVTLKDERLTGLKRLLRHIIIIDDLSNIQIEEIKAAFSKSYIVSKKGTVITREGMLKWPGASDILSGALLQEERKQGLHRDRELATNEVEALAEEEKRLQQLINEKNSSLSQLSELTINKKIALESNEKISSSITEQLNKVQDHHEVLLSELAEAEGELQNLSERSIEIENKLNQVEAELHSKQQAIEDENNYILEKEKTREDLHVETASLESKCSAVNEKEDYLRNAVEIVTLSLQSEDEAKAKNESELQTNRAKIVELQRENTQNEERLSGASGEVETIENSLNNAKTKRSSLTASREQEMAQNSQLTKAYDEKKDAVHAINLQEVELRYQESSIKERIQQSYKIDVLTFDFNTLDTEAVNFETLDEDVEALKNKVESLGTVNLLAIEEYKELKDRYSFLVEQRTDLDNAQRSLLEAIRKINRTTKQLFIDVFAQVQINFKNYFKILFEGGVAELILVDEENPLESGIDIVVRPPGKKLQNVTLLSGGEKALTAVALLFALFKVKPSPFCVLDEVDAPLDEANIDRFLNVVREFLNTTQFIIVTHSRKTIGMADTLFGVTMEEPGISKIVSVRVSDVNLEDAKTLKEGDTHRFDKKEKDIEDTIEEIFKEVQ